MKIQNMVTRSFQFFFFLFPHTHIPHGCNICLKVQFLPLQSFRSLCSYCMYRNGSYKCHFILYVPTKIPLSSAATHVKNSVIFLCIRCKKAVLFLCIRCKKCHFRMFLSAIRGNNILCFSVLRVKNAVMFLCTTCEKYRYFPLYQV